MKRISLAVASALLFAAPAAHAADMPLKAPPAPAPIFSWTGFYIGADVGGAWGSENVASAPLLSLAKPQPRVLSMAVVFSAASMPVTITA